MAKKIDLAVGRAAVRAAKDGSTARTDVATAVRYLLQLLEEKAPGKSVEVRVPPFGAVQIVQGLAHTRGTPPNVTETDAQTWIALATGEMTWAEAEKRSLLAVSGTRADISDLLPVLW
ncbi:sterol carrier family protein [Microbacterium indicum]|uniref:sterol carrier family protein n=1 Tax=Microbacterium indicum TaxID=358100 RepID=UPI000424AC9B|nr:sterol carrier family protein [Microbacterium indicum]